MSDYWTPKEGEQVWMNYPDFERPLGKVVGFVPEGNLRAGQPIIECQQDEGEGGIFKNDGRRKGDRFVVAPPFLLPFPYYGDEWKRAQSEGRIRPPGEE